MDLEVSEDREKDCKPSVEIFIECLEERIIKGRFTNGKVKEGEMIVYLNGVCVSARWEFFKRVGQ